MLQVPADDAQAPPYVEEPAPAPPNVDAPVADAILPDVLQVHADDAQAPPAPEAPQPELPVAQPLLLGGVFANAAQDIRQVRADAEAMFLDARQREAAIGNYMPLHTHINEPFRANVVQRLMLICAAKGLRCETFHLTINIIDRYLSVSMVTAPECMLLGGVAVLIASKFVEESVGPLPTAC